MLCAPLEANVHISQIQWLFITLAVVAAGVQVFILRVLNQRKLRSEFPVFFRYFAFCIVGCAICLVPFVVSCPQYFYVYWALTAVDHGFGVWCSV